MTQAKILSASTYIRPRRKIKNNRSSLEFLDDGVVVVGAHPSPPTTPPPSAANTTKVKFTSSLASLSTPIIHGNGPASSPTRTKITTASSSHTKRIASFRGKYHKRVMTPASQSKLEKVIEMAVKDSAISVNPLKKGSTGSGGRMKRTMTN